ncbi:hypothetical protein T4C_13577 [Trichinella pseudospiralis]|uniref:Uncharacterized protein n=1 Tax=Trichinella pseudospiralis TaxID=6337 RepID=A0A0V1GAF2_TRIPS|nr:hypothetical protein T4C_13577 [Trichinella pseudospiralis]
MAKNFFLQFGFERKKFSACGISGIQSSFCLC